jgi:hypothetical protein
MSGREAPLRFKCTRRSGAGQRAALAAALLLAAACCAHAALPEPWAGGAAAASSPAEQLRAAVAAAADADELPRFGGASRALKAVAPPNPSSTWCGGPPAFNWGTTSGQPGSCLGDVATAAGAAQPVCTPTDVAFTMPYLHFHQARSAGRIARACDLRDPRGTFGPPRRMGLI